MNKWSRMLPWKQRQPVQRDQDVPRAPGKETRPLPQPPTVSQPGLPPVDRRTPLPTAAALRRSLDLAQMTYTLDITPWMEAGWTDFSFQIDDVLESGAAGHISTAEDEEFWRLASLKRMQRAQAALRARNPLVQVMAALRQREGSDTVKAVCMAHELPGGRWLIAIGFMGTGKRFYDWFSNFRFTREDGFHKGFFQLCSHFEEAMDGISFPQVAARLGRDRLTLADVVTDLHNPDTPFRVWMAGHSQGSAVMQVFTHRLLHHYGVRPASVQGYGFASPTVAFDGLTHRPDDYPLWHLINRDDLVPRIGAQVHLGRCLEYTPDEAFRQRAYQRSGTPADAACRAWMQPLLHRIRDTADNLLSVTALILCVLEEKGDDSLHTLLDSRWRIPGLDWLRTRMDGHRQSTAQQFLAHQRRTYEALTGQPLEEEQLRARMEPLRPQVAATPLRRILAVLVESLAQPHGLRDEETDQPLAYAHMMQLPIGRFRPFQWAYRCGLPVRQYAPVRTRRPLRRGKARLGRNAPRGKGF